MDISHKINKSYYLQKLQHYHEKIIQVGGYVCGICLNGPNEEPNILFTKCIHCKYVMCNNCANLLHLNPNMNSCPHCRKAPLKVSILLNKNNDLYVNDQSSAKQDSSNNIIKATIPNFTMNKTKHIKSINDVTVDNHDYKIVELL
jgi:hypothetical protein